MRLGLAAFVAALALVADGAAPGAIYPGVNFISVCGFSHRAADDPIVYPGQPGVSHDHSFVGNTSTNASSTLASLHKAGTTCQRRADTAAYWMPTLFLGGRAVPPAEATIYYQRDAFKKLRPFPQGLKMIAGNYQARRPQSLLVTSWDCGDLVDVARSSNAPTCPPGTSLRLRVNFPDCWNGKSLDSPSHFSTKPLSASAFISRTIRGGSANMLRTANINNVPMPFGRVTGNTFCRAPWCIRWKPTMVTSHTESFTARFSIALVKSLIGFSVMPMCLILPFCFCSSIAGTTDIA